MNKIIFLFFSLILFVNCESDEYNKKLRQERIKLENQIRKNRDINNSLQIQISELSSELTTLKTERNIYKSGKTPKFLICLNIHQSTITLDIEEHIKNNLNDLDIWIETSESFYKNVKKGQTLSNNFKSGSFLINGDLSRLNIKIKDKKIIK